MNSIAQTFASVFLNKFILSMAVLAILLNCGLSLTEKWAVGVIPANAQELLDLQACADKSNNHQLEQVVIASIAKPISKHQAVELLEQCSK